MKIINRDSDAIDQYTPGFCQYCGRRIIFGEKSDGGRPVLDPLYEEGIGGNHRVTCPSPLNPHRIIYNRDSELGKNNKIKQLVSLHNSKELYKGSIDEKVYVKKTGSWQDRLQNFSKKLDLSTKIRNQILQIILKKFDQLYHLDLPMDAIIAALIFYVARKCGQKIQLTFLASVSGQLVGTIKDGICTIGGRKILEQMDQDHSQILRSYKTIDSSNILDEDKSQLSDISQIMREYRKDLLSSNYFPPKPFFPPFQ